MHRAQISALVSLIMEPDRQLVQLPGNWRMSLNVCLTRPGPQAENIGFKMSLVVRKPVFGVSDQVRHKPVCAITEDG